MDQLILAARDVVDAWEHHTVELEIVIHRLAEALENLIVDPQMAAVETEELHPAVA